MISREQLETIAKNPRQFLQQNNKIEEQIRIKRRRIAKLQQVSVQVTSSVKAVSAYTGPGDKIGNCVIETVALTGELEEQINQMLETQKIIGEALELLIPDRKQRTIMEARYLAGMTWEQIAYEFHYAYRWVMRLHKQALEIMRKEAEACLTSYPDRT